MLNVVEPQDGGILSSQITFGGEGFYMSYKQTYIALSQKFCSSSDTTVSLPQLI